MYVSLQLCYFYIYLIQGSFRYEIIGNYLVFLFFFFNIRYVVIFKNNRDDICMYDYIFMGIIFLYMQVLL